MLVLGAIMLVLAGFVASRSARLAEQAREAGGHRLLQRRSTWLAGAGVVFVLGALNVLSAS